MKKTKGNYYLLENCDDVIINLNACIEIESVQGDFGKEILYRPPINEENILNHDDFSMTHEYLLLSLDEFDNKKMKVLDFKDAMKWCIKKELDELFEKEFKEDLDLTDLKLIN